MKITKKAAIFIVSVILAVINICTVFYAEEIVPVYINGNNIYFSPTDAQPQIYQGRTYVPIRPIAESLGLEVTWNAKTQTFTFSRDGLTIEHTMRSNIVYVNDNPLIFDTRSINVQNRTLMPVRMLGESIGATVDWDSSERAVYIYTSSDSSNNGYNSSNRYDSYIRSYDLEEIHDIEGGHEDTAIIDRVYIDYMDDNSLSGRLRIKGYSEPTVYFTGQYEPSNQCWFECNRHYRVTTTPDIGLFDIHFYNNGFWAEMYYIDSFFS